MSSLNPARRRLHAASQWLARLAYAFAVPSDDDSHSALRWQNGELHTQPLGTAGPARLDSITLALTLAGRCVPLADMDGRQRYDAVISLLALAGLDGTRLEVALPWTGEAPDADVAAEREIQVSAVQALASLYDDAAATLQALTETTEGASPVRLWPHHFDVATLLTQTSPFESIGVGLAPDDEHFDSPYWYVAPWPPATGELPQVPDGWHWHTQGFTALIKPCEDGRVGEVDAAMLTQLIGLARQATPGAAPEE